MLFKRLISVAVLPFHIAAMSSATATVTSLNSSTMNDYLLTNTISIIEFHAPWCYHCVRFQEEFRSTSELSLRRNFNISFAAVDVTHNARLASQFDVSNIPALFYLHNGKVWRYEGGLSRDSIIEFVENIADHPFLPFWDSPLGVMGSMRGMMSDIKTTSGGILPATVSYLGVSRWMAFFLLAIGTSSTLLIATALFVCIDHSSKR